MKTNDRVRRRIAADLGGEEPRGVLRLHRVAREGHPNRDGAISSTSSGEDVEARLLARHGLDPGPSPGLGPQERRELVATWMTVTDTRLVFHANNAGFWVVRPRPAELRTAVARSQVPTIEYADHTGLALVWRLWLLCFDDGTWLLGHSMVRGRASRIGTDDESDLAVTALGPHAIAAPVVDLG